MAHDSDTPRLLMISHCFPAQTGVRAVTRSWQLLSRAADSYRVTLACVPDAPVHLAQWRLANYLTQDIVLARPCAWWRRPELDLQRALGPLLAARPATRSIQVVLCAHPDLERAVSLPHALRIDCDLRMPSGVKYGLRALAQIARRDRRPSDQPSPLRLAA